MHELMWFLHNTISHPVMGLLKLLGFDRAAEVVHDMTVPTADMPHVGITDDGEEVVAVIRITPEYIETGNNLTALLAMSNGFIRINKPAEGAWVVEFRQGDEWRSESASQLNTALDQALNAQSAYISDGGKV